MSALLSVHGHSQEPTLVSLTETVGKYPESSRVASSASNSSGGGTNVSPSPERSIFVKPLPAHEETIDPRKRPASIPPDHDHRTLVLCFDGTGDQFDADNSNIVHFFSLLKKDDRSKQLVYYQSGIGTYTSPKVATPFMSILSKTLDTMIAWNIDAHVMDGYEFLMQNYTVGDRICIFGFSRGAYTARALAGMIHKVGLLPTCNYQQVPFAYKMYTRADPIGWEQSNAFKKAFSIDVEIEFIGVWDTVNSVGLIPRRLPFTTSNTVVRTFRHAISLDERRAKFKANLWNRPNAEEAKLGLHVKTMPTGPDIQSEKDKKTHKHHSSFTKDNEEEHMLSALEHMYSENHDCLTDIEEVWFAGCHCDVGGGSVSNKTQHSLARISLRWMIRECFKTKTGIMFDAERLKTIGLDPATLYPFVTPRPPPLPVGSSRIAKTLSKTSRFRLPWSTQPSSASTCPQPRSSTALHIPTSVSEEEEELKDAMSPAYDQLKIKRLWWILELIPMEFRYQMGNDNHWISCMNLARPRVIPKQRSNGVKVHRSVRMRMDAYYENIDPKKLKKYLPEARLKVEPTWVD